MQLRSSAAHAAPVPEPTLQFDVAHELAELEREDKWQAGRNSKTLAKYPDFRVVLVALAAGTHVWEHKAAGPISVLTVAGHISIKLPDRQVELRAGELLVLDRAVPHDVKAREDSAFLLTLGWSNTAGRAATREAVEPVLVSTASSPLP